MSFEFELFRESSQPIGLRRHVRHSVVEDQGWLGWWEGRSFRRTPVTLVDLSLGGTRMVAEIVPALKGTAWVRLAGSPRVEWVEGDILEVIRHPDGTAEVRMSFRETCPFNVMEAAVQGSAESLLGAIV